MSTATPTPVSSSTIAARRVLPEGATLESALTSPFWFRVWLLSKPIGGFVGYRAKYSTCPLASFLSEQGFENPQVFRVGAVCLDGSGQKPVESQRWHQNFVMLVDDFDPDGLDPDATPAITREDALQKLDWAIAMAEGMA